MLCGQEIEPPNFDLCQDCKCEIKRTYDNIFRSQPKQNRDIDQFPMDFESILLQNIFMKQSYDGNAFSFLGGYDGVGLLANFFGEKKVIVLDFDVKVLEWWEKIGKEYGFEVFPLEYNFLDPVTDEIYDIVKSYHIDAWRTDPPYNCAGMFCFLSRLIYLNHNKSPIYLCVPDGNQWSQLLKHNLWKILNECGMRFTGVSPYLFHYPHPEGTDSFAWKIEYESHQPFLPNKQFTFNIYSATLDFAISPLGCNQYERCRARRNEWDVIIKTMMDQDLNEVK